MRDGVDPRAMGILSGVRWWAGWRPAASALAGGGLLGFLLANALVTRWIRWLGSTTDATDVVRAAVAPVAFFVLFGVAVGVTLWALGVREVNERYRDGPAAFVDRHRSPVDPGAVLLATDASAGDTGATAERVRFLDAPARVAGAHVTLDDAAVTFRDVTVDVASRRIRLADGVRTVPYDRIAVVDSGDGAVVVETTGGESFRFADTANATAVADELRAAWERTRT